MSGIERDVFLFSQPKTHIKDFNVVSTLDDTYKNGIFKLNVDVTNHTAANKEVTVAYELLDAAKKVVAEGNTPCPVTADGQKSISFEAALSNVKTWTSEHPNLYRLLISLKDGEKNKRNHSLYGRFPPFRDQTNRSDSRKRQTIRLLVRQRPTHQAERCKHTRT